ncbi:rhamnulokinase [Sanguibacter gelidistatuariae]|uniref:Rhamnulokinase n=1 Tax=Sanguibacter gelidistatuariae TaxID=1814289 RepID=A0A1G6UR51_9MICO|nr:rhamnulokinase family protein [Sanguibacter gelidistatuariae]SDD43769.1 rhamnulokinase [Sanguibacter gelidistatuariae]
MSKQDDAGGAAAFVAVDIGASSGRVIVGRVLGGPAPGGRVRGEQLVELHEVNRFPNGPVDVGGTLHWDVLRLYQGVTDGLRAAAGEIHTRGDVLVGIGIDSWAVDYGLLDADGALLANPVHYRDSRTAGVSDRVFAQISAADHYSVNGLQTQPFNTEFQLVAAARSALKAAAASLLLIPDLLGYWLTGKQVAEVTNASTTGLLDVRTRDWSASLLDRLEEAFGGESMVTFAGLLPRVVEPGTIVGPLRPAVAHALGISGAVPVIAVGSHDTASAVVAVPASGENFAYISCGTWSLVGLELSEPVLSEASREANFTNELGVDGTVRYLRNVMGLWLLQESIRTWKAAGLPADLPDLLAAAAQVPALTTVIDVDSPEFLAPGDMPARIAEAAERTGQTPPRSQAETVRCILDSLALAYRRAVRQASELSGRVVDVVHVVGGGVRNELLCQLTADATGLPVVAGPVEGAALGNVLVQARAAGVLTGDLAALRAVGARGVALARYEPSDGVGHVPEPHWAVAEHRLVTAAVSDDEDLLPA